ncbi:hypothetical protein [Streptomyces sp. enrichment culture]|uniref:hypothetical protein n=1 Tax=Streptomyces sp. enrichment culture TaxID=1795815 RepID=UPI003F567E7A
MDEVIGWVFGLSYSSPVQLGEQKAAFEQDLRAALLAFDRSRQFDEVIRTEAIIAIRP